MQHDSHFNRWFFRNFIRDVFTSRGFFRFNCHCLTQLLAWRFFLWLPLTRRQRPLVQKYFHSIPLLTWLYRPYIVLFSLEKLLRWKKISTHTYRHHNRKQTSSMNFLLFQNITSTKYFVKMFRYIQDIISAFSKDNMHTSNKIIYLVDHLILAYHNVKKC